MNKYRFKYNWKKAGVMAHETKDISAPSPVSALNQFHSFLQTLAETLDGRRMLRPKLKPDEYKLDSMVQTYFNLDHRGKVMLDQPVDSAIDLPKTPNPDLNKVLNAYALPEQEGFGFKGAGV
jgi:hypothetical protein